ncbi:unnamed protein product, partial [Lasius platythorax]
SDHFLVCMKYRARIMRGKTGSSLRPKRLHLEKLRIPESAIDYQHGLLGALEACNKKASNTDTTAGCAVEET